MNQKCFQSRLDKNNNSLKVYIFSTIFLSNRNKKVCFGSFLIKYACVFLVKLISS